MATEPVDVVVIGAGFAGLRTLYALRESGHSVRVLEASDEVGGVWNFNRYPGARCDVESYDYSLSFSAELEQEWRWTERYATQGEVLAYIRHVAERFDLLRDITFSTRMTQAQWDASSECWTVSTDTGDTVSCRFLVMASGQLSKPKKPCISGESDFRGAVYLSACWPREPVNFSGKKVGIIGTGSSGVQMTPVIARAAAHLSVFQRTANFSIPACHADISDEEDAAVKANYASRRERTRNSPSGLGFVPNGASALDDPPDVREAVYEQAYNRLGFGFALAYKDVLLDEAANETAADFLRRKIAEKVIDPQTRERLTPKGFPFGAMRPSVDDGYYEAFNRDNVTLVDVRENPIIKITASGVLTRDQHIDLDILIYATGFDVFTGALLAPQIIGRDELTLRRAWQDGPNTYLGLGVNGFPNFFVVCGPGSPSLLSNVLVSTEEHADLIAGLVTHMKLQGYHTVEPTIKAVEDWGRLVAERAAETLYPKAQSYYMGGEISGKPRVFMPYSGGVRGYRRILGDMVSRGYDGFEFH